RGGTPSGGFRALIEIANSKRRGSPRALIDRALGVELHRHIRAADQPGTDAHRFERADQIATRLLPRADHDGVDVQRLWLAVDAEMQSGIVDPVVLDPGDHHDAATLEQRAPDPAGRLGQSGADFSSLSLEPA